MFERAKLPRKHKNNNEFDFMILIHLRNEKDCRKSRAIFKKLNSEMTSN